MDYGINYGLVSKTFRLKVDIANALAQQTMNIGWSHVQTLSYMLGCPMGTRLAKKYEQKNRKLGNGEMRKCFNQHDWLTDLRHVCAFKPSQPGWPA